MYGKCNQNLKKDNLIQMYVEFKYLRKKRKEKKKRNYMVNEKEMSHHWISFKRLNKKNKIKSTLSPMALGL